MIKDFLVFAGKTLIQMVFWVVVLSVNWNERRLFDRIHEIVIENSVVYSLDDELGKLWFKVKETAKLTFLELSKNEETL